MLWLSSPLVSPLSVPPRHPVSGCQATYRGRKTSSVLGLCRAQNNGTVLPPPQHVFKVFSIYFTSNLSLTQFDLCKRFETLMLNLSAASQCTLIPSLRRSCLIGLMSCGPSVVYYDWTFTNGRLGSAVAVTLLLVLVWQLSDVSLLESRASPLSVVAPGKYLSDRQEKDVRDS